ncbi:site-specific integrase [Echinicola sp. 20G]|uniref:site-specific integrase n=1 Tax=Echinicola sp. 20G TaxID=2781961 RepID=UPI001910EF61|nr:site-specific integrase [Echinicola sp. 20G]
MAKYKLYLRDKSKDGETPITLFVNYNGKRLKYPTGKSIHPKLWNDNTQQIRVVKTYPNAKSVNNTLSNIVMSAQKSFELLESQLHRIPTTEELKEQIDLELSRSNEEVDTERLPTFLELFDRFIEESKNGLRLTSSGKRFDKRSIQKYQTVQKSLVKFNKRYNLTFESIDKNFYSKYVDQLNRKETKLKDGKEIVTKPSFSLNNVGKYIQVIKTFLNYATENGYNSNLYYQSRQFKAYKVPGFSIYLNEEEIKKLYEKNLSKTPALERVRDLFIVGCWTGLRFSDFTSIKPENIEGNFLKITTFKTNEKVVIPIHYMVRDIMAKYEGKYPNSLPPAISNQKMNSYLKEIAKKLDCFKTSIDAESTKGGLRVTEKKHKWELITTHTARRSFATNVYKSGFPAISLMKITGHRTEKAFLLYIKVTPEENAKQLLEHWNKRAVKAI